MNHAALNSDKPNINILALKRKYISPDRFVTREVSIYVIKATGKAFVYSEELPEARSVIGDENICFANCE